MERLLWVFAVVALLILNITTCSRKTATVETVKELTTICADRDYLLSVIDSMANAPRDTQVVVSTVWKTYEKTVIKRDTLTMEPLVQQYITINDTADMAIVLDTIVVAGELLEHRQAILIADTVKTIEIPVPYPVEIRDTVQILTIQRIKTPARYQAHAGILAGSYANQAVVGPSFSFSYNRLQLGVVKPLTNDGAIFFQAGYRFFAR